MATNKEFEVWRKHLPELLTCIKDNKRCFINISIGAYARRIVTENMLKDYMSNDNDMNSGPKLLLKIGDYIKKKSKNMYDVLDLLKKEEEFSDIVGTMTDEVQGLDTEGMHVMDSTRDMQRGIIYCSHGNLSPLNLCI